MPPAPRTLALSLARLLPIAFAALSTAAAQEARPRVRAIVLHRAAVFDSAETRFWPWRVANAIHAETRPGVIRRELLLGVGDPWDPSLVAESERNLRALRIFRDVRIDEQFTDSGVVLHVRTADAWTTTAGGSVATSGTESIVDLSLQEGNLFGTRTVAVLAYRNDPDRSSIALAFDTPRAIGDVVGLGASIVNRSDGRGRTASLRLPFLSLSARTGAALNFSAFEGRVLQFANGAVVDSLWREASYLRLEGAMALAASPRGYVRLGVLAQVRRDDMVPLADRTTLPRTRTVAGGPFLALRAPRYIRVRDVERIGQVEDIDLGASLLATVLAAPRAWGYGTNGVGVSLGVSAGVRLPAGFARAALRASTLETGAGRDTATVEGGVTIVAQPGARHLGVLHASAGRQWNAVPGREFDLGLGQGLRAWPSHAFTGDRFFLLAAEYRLLVWPRVFGVAGVGGAAFAGHAGAWTGGQARRTGTEIGAGLRVASLREAAAIWRLDLSRRSAASGVAAGWVVSLGRGFVFGGI